MKTALRSFKNQQYKLVIDEPGLKPNEKAVVATMELYEGLGVWTLTDLRIKLYAQAGPYFTVSADHFNAHFMAKTPEAARIARRLLRESVHSNGLDNPLVQWCTYDGIVRGRTPQEMGVQASFMNNHSFLHTRKEGMAHMDEIVQFWAQSGISESDPEVRNKASALKINNPWRQLSEIGLDMKVHALLDRAHSLELALKEERESTTPKGTLKAARP